MGSVVSNLPLSARGTVKFKPLEEALAAAKNFLEAQINAGEPLDAPKKLVADIEEMIAEGNPEYSLKVPTIPSKFAAQRDLDAKGIRLNTNKELVEALRLALEEGQIADEDTAFIAEVIEKFTADGEFEDGAWARIYNAGRGAERSAKLLAARVYYDQMRNWYLVKHHLKLPNEALPLSDEALGSVPESDYFAIANKLNALIRPTKEEAKN